MSDEPDESDEPADPEGLAEPDEPVASDERDGLGAPIAPALLDEPAEPVVPAAPVALFVSADPAAPVMPAEPEEPADPGIAGEADAPAVSAALVEPLVPVAPVLAVAPDPAVPAAAMSVDPDAPVGFDVSAAPGDCAVDGIAALGEADPAVEREESVAATGGVAWSVVVCAVSCRFSQAANARMIAIGMNRFIIWSLSVWEKVWPNASGQMTRHIIGLEIVRRRYSAYIKFIKPLCDKSASQASTSWMNVIR